MPRTLNKAGVALIKEFEGLRLETYDDLQPKVHLTPSTKIKGTLTIGIGHTGPDVKVGLKITEAQALRLFDADSVEAREDVSRALSGVVLSSNQFAACVSLAYNIGGANFAKSSVVRNLRAGDYDKAATAFALWNKAKDPDTGSLVVMEGLTRRRAAEAHLYMTPDDYDQRELLPEAKSTLTPAEVEASPNQADVVKRTIAQVTTAVTIPGSVWKAAESAGLSGIPLYLIVGVAVAALAYLLRKQIKKVLGL